jgi:protein-tyrosine phosphatase
MTKTFGMIDIHCHILPCVDDGPQSLNEALAMLKKCELDGITHIVATPHCNQNLRLFCDNVPPHVEKLNEEIAKHGLDVRIFPGTEITLYNVDIFKRNYEEKLYCHLGNDARYSLIEFPWKADRFPEGALELMTWLHERGTQPIVAHPERTAGLRENLDFVRELMDAGCWLQISVDSIVGNNSSLAQKVARQLLSEYSDIVLATDSHNLQRCSGLRIGYEWVRREFGQERETDLRERANQILLHLTKEN